MGEDLIGKYYYMKNIDSLVCIGSQLSFTQLYLCRRLMKAYEGFGYSSDTDAIVPNNSIMSEIDYTIWNKIYKILRMNAVSCNIIVQNCKRYESPTGYYVSTFTTKLQYYKLFEVLEDSQILTRFSHIQARILELKTDSAIKIEKMFSISDEWISSETYHRIEDNVINTIEEIDDIWPIV